MAGIVSVSSENFTPRACGMFRRLAAIFYDSLLLFAVLFAATAMLMPFTRGNAINSENILYFAYLTTWSYIFFGWQWTHGGQTLGMRAWKLKLFAFNLGPVGWALASKRFFLAMLSWLFAGAGFIWAIFDADKLAFHDRYSRTRLYKVDNK
jgi:uncharacterized RDD family membrane protein YckC